MRSRVLEVGRCAWEAAYSADSPSSKPSSAARRQLGSGFDGGDERTAEGFKEDEQEFRTSL
jgi:hypothetical protein